MAKLARHAKATGRYLLSVQRRMYPHMVCLFGMSAPVILSPNHIMVGIFIAAFSFAWAIDLAETRATAAARSEAAAQITAFLTSGNDSTITVDIYRHALLNEKKERIDA